MNSLAKSSDGRWEMLELQIESYTYTNPDKQVSDRRINEYETVEGDLDSELSYDVKFTNQM